MKNIKFITTLNENGYHVYGQSWIDSFLEFTKNYNNITAKIYINDMDISSLNYGPKIEIVDFNVAIPNHKDWLDAYKINDTHDQWNKDLGVKFSYKSFVMMDALNTNNDCYVVWLDADCIFKSYDFNTFTEDVLQGTFVACQREAGSEHVESGIIIFDTEHPDKQIYLDKFKSYYMDPKESNEFGQFFDGYVVGRTLNVTEINYVDLNKDYGLGGVQSDPNCTFLNPEIGKRFHHNIGITGKRNYQNWEDFVDKDPMFQLIHGVNDKPEHIQLAENLEKIREATKGFIV